MFKKESVAQLEVRLGIKLPADDSAEEEARFYRQVLELLYADEEWKLRIPEVIRSLRPFYRAKKRGGWTMTIKQVAEGNPSERHIVVVHTIEKHTHPNADLRYGRFGPEAILINIGHARPAFRKECCPA